MLEGHVSGSEDPDEAVALGRYFASWPVPFDATVMQRTIEAVHEPRWQEWTALRVP